MRMPTRTLAVVWMGLLSAAHAAPPEGGALEPLEVQGSFAASPILAELVSQWHETSTARRAVWTGYPNRNLARHFADRKCDVAVHSGNWGTEDLAVLQQGFGDVQRLRRFPLGSFAVVCIVNAKSPVKSLTRRQLEQIYRDQIREWGDIAADRKGRALRYYTLNEQSNANYIVQQQAFFGHEFGPRLKDFALRPLVQQIDPEALLGLVAKDEDAIGFVLYDARRVWDPRVRPLAIASDEKSKPELPTLESISAGRYLLADSLTLFVPPQATPESIGFCRFAASHESAKIAARHGLVPLADYRRVQARERLAAVKAGHAPKVRVAGSRIHADLVNGLFADFVEQIAALDGSFAPTAQDVSLARLRSGEIDAVIGEGAMDAAAHAGLREEVVGTHTVAFFVSWENKLPALDTEGLRQLQSARLDKKAYPALANLQVFGLPSSDESSKLLTDWLGSPVKGRTEFRETAAKVLTSVGGGANHLGWANLSEIPRGAGQIRVLPLAIKNAKGATKIVEPEDADYPIRRKVWLLTREPIPAGIASWLEHLRSGEANGVLRRFGVTPIPSPEAPMPVLLPDRAGPKGPRD